MPIKMHKMLLFFLEKKLNLKKMCLSYLKSSGPLPETHLFFYLSKKKEFRNRVLGLILNIIQSNLIQFHSLYTKEFFILNLFDT